MIVPLSSSRAISSSLRFMSDPRSSLALRYAASASARPKPGGSEPYPYLVQIGQGDIPFLEALLVPLRDVDQPIDTPLRVADRLASRQGRDKSPVNVVDPLADGILIQRLQDALGTSGNHAYVPAVCGKCRADR